MDDQMNQGMPNMPGSVPPQPTDAGMGSMSGGVTPPPPPMGGPAEEHPHEQILAALARIEEKLAAIAAKLGA